MGLAAADSLSGKCCDKLLAAAGFSSDWARTIDISLNFTAGGGGTAGFDAVFFAKTCEIGIFGVAPREGGALPVPSIGLDAGLSLTGTTAIYAGSGSGGSDTWVGSFDSVNLGGGPFAEVGVTAYWGGGWTGLGGGVGLGSPITASYNQTDYKLLQSISIPKSICCAIKLKAAGL